MPDDWGQAGVFSIKSCIKCPSPFSIDQLPLPTRNRSQERKATHLPAAGTVMPKQSTMHTSPSSQWPGRCTPPTLCGWVTQGKRSSLGQPILRHLATHSMPPGFPYEFTNCVHIHAPFFFLFINWQHLTRKPELSKRSSQ